MRSQARMHQINVVFSSLLIPWFCLGASLGSKNVYASDGLDAYRQGNYVEAAEKLTNASNKDPIDNYYAGKMRLYGYGQLKSNTLAMRHFQYAAEKGVLSAQQIMARHALIEENDLEKALYWFKKSADANDVQAQMYCASAYLFGVGVKKNADLARRYYIAAAKNGDSTAQYTLAENFMDSRQVASKKLGLIWLNKAVAKNNPQAQLKLGELYAKGELVDKDLVKAKEMIGLSIAQNYVPAIYQMGEFFQQQNDPKEALVWYKKAEDAHYKPAEVAIASLYTQEKSPLYDLKTGFSLMLKAAQNGSSDAQLALASMYKNGQGVDKDDALAKQWQDMADKSAKSLALSAEANAAEWLSNKKAFTFIETPYQLKGIFSDWHNPEALKENNYNSAPEMDNLTRDILYKPSFVMTNPNDIPIGEFYDALATSLSEASAGDLALPHYPLDPTLTSLQQTKNQATIDLLLGRAALGDSTAQFSLGQLYQDGIGINKNVQDAIKYYELASAQQDLRAEYNLGLLYLEGNGIPADYPKAESLLRDAAFKGNELAQFVIGRTNEQGYRNSAGELVIKPDSEQAMVMYDLASANDYGPAQYRLAEMLVRQKKDDMSVAAVEKRNATIKLLYQGAVSAGVEQAALPLAFFNAMDKDKAKQAQAFAVAKKEADAGHPGAALLLGLLYDRGIAVAQSQEDALYWYQHASSKNPVSAFILGTYMSQGTGISKDEKKGRSLLLQAADADFSYANLNLAVMKEQSGETFLPELDKALVAGNSTAGLLLADYYLSVANDVKQMQQARDIFKHFAEKGDKNGQLKLGFMYEKGLGGSVDVAEAAKWYQLAADQDHATAQYLLGNLYQVGRIGSEPDYAEAKKWYSSAQGNYVPAAIALGFIHDTVDDDYQKALIDYQLAADKHSPIGAYDLGLIYENGKGTPVDFKKAVALYQEAADQGHRQAMVQLAGLYFNGQADGTRDEEKALYWYEKAASLGDRDALYQLGLLSETGVSTKLDFNDALRYYQQAADKGNAKAMLALARMYQYGIGVSKDMQKAAAFYKALAESGNAYAEYQLATIYYEGIDGQRMPDKGKQLLQQAQDNGSPQARRTLQWLSAQAEERTSFIEPMLMNQANAVAGRPVDLMYLDALNDWNRGDELSSRLILDKIMTEFPHYIPAKRAYEQLNQQFNPRNIIS